MLKKDRLKQIFTKPERGFRSFSNTVNIRNRQASFEFELLDTYVAGIALKGTEIKSIR